MILHNNYFHLETRKLEQLYQDTTQHYYLEMDLRNLGMMKRNLIQMLFSLQPFKELLQGKIGANERLRFKSSD